VSVELARRYEDAMARRDLDALEPLLDPEVVVVTPKGAVIEGPAAVRRYFGGAGFDHLEVTHEAHDFHLHAGGVRMTARQVYRWKETGEHAYERPLTVSFTFRGERIARVEMRIEKEGDSDG
jgi:ketosteroid isomerase-like protein